MTKTFGAPSVFGGSAVVLGGLIFFLLKKKKEEKTTDAVHPADDSFESADPIEDEVVEENEDKDQ